MAGENLLFQIDQIVVDGQALAFESGTGELINAAGFENEGVASATGDDFVKRKRVVRELKLKLQFANTTDPQRMAAQSNVQIAARDTQGGRKALLNRCAFKSMGSIGGGSVELSYLVLTPIQWM